MKKLVLISAIVSLILLIGCGGSKSGSNVADDEIAALKGAEKIQVLKEKIQEKPYNMLYRRQLAEAYMEAGENLQALAVLEDAFQVAPGDGETLFLYAEIAAKSGEHLKEYKAYKKILESADGDTYFDRIAPKFVDIFTTTKVIGDTADEAFGSYSADGTKIIYQTNVNGNWDIYQYDITTQTTTPLVVTEAEEENPSFSPDGTTIAYTSTEADHRDVDYNQKLRDIFIMNLYTKRAVNLTTNGSNDWRPRYSPDGKYIAFVSERNDLRDVPFIDLYSDVFIMENDGRFQLKLTDTKSHNGGPCILAGGTEQKGTIYFDSDRSGYYAIYAMDMKGQNVRQITFSSGSNDVSPAVSANGEKIVFFSDRDGNYDIFMMNSDGSAQQKLTSNSADDTNPEFSPDGNKVLFHSNRSGNYDIYELDLTQQSEMVSKAELMGIIDNAIMKLE
jgi:Tol biopolymer transport system component